MDFTHDAEKKVKATSVVMIRNVGRRMFFLLFSGLI